MSRARDGYLKPLPTVTTEDREFWAAARQHRFVLPQCRACGHVWFPPYASCPSCLSFDRGWTEASGRGTVWGFTILRQPYIPSFKPELPYNVVLVELEEGPMVYSNLVGVENTYIACGLPVEAVFEDATDEITLIKFRPRTTSPVVTTRGRVRTLGNGEASPPQSAFDRLLPPL